MAKLSSKIIVLFVLLSFSPAQSIISSGQTAQTGPKAGRLVFESPTGKTAEAQKLKVTDELLQFTVGGHILGFRKREMFIASGDHGLKVEFVNARPVSPGEEMKSPDPEKTDAAGKAPSLVRVTYPGVWDGVNAVYEKSVGGIVKSSYRIEAGARGNPVESIRLRYNRPVRIGKNGDLVIAYERGEMREQAPTAWQEAGGSKIPVDVVYRLVGENEIGFRVASYNGSFPLVIDPSLTWNTFLGGGDGEDYVTAAAVDGSGNVYVTGYSDATWGSPIRAYTRGKDAFVAKLDKSGNMIWNTFLGGWSALFPTYVDDTGGNIAVDRLGYVYVVGTSDFTWGSPIRAHSLFGEDAFVAELDSSGALIWNTFLGGQGGMDFGGDIAVPYSGEVYVAGHSYASWGSPIRAFSGDRDAFAAELDGNGYLIWNTFLGDVGADSGGGIAVDGGGNVCITGYSYASWGSPIRAFSGDADAFAARLDQSGNLIWNTFLGEKSGGSDIAVDGPGNVYVSGYSDATWGSPIRAFSGYADAFAAKLDINGNLIWNTFLGGGQSDSDGCIAVDRSGNVYIAGLSVSTWGSPSRAFSGSQDVYAAKLDRSGALQWNTFLGGYAFEFGVGMAVDGSGNVYVTGHSNATWGLPVSPYTWEDGFVAKLVEKDDFLGTWDGQGVYYRNSETGKWIKLSSPANLIATGDLEGNDKDDLIGIWPGQGGVWVRYSKTGGWAKLSSTAKHIAAGDMNGDGRVDLLGTWDGQGVYYRDSTSGTWTKLASPADLITAGDLDGDDKDDLIGIWPTQGGVWVKYSKTALWARLSSSARDIATGDVNGDGREDLVGTWDGQGTYYRNSISGGWVKMSAAGEQITAGDLDGDGIDDLIGLWASQGGIWVKYSKTGAWSKLSSPAKDITTGLMRGAFWGSSRFGFIGLQGPVGGSAEGPSNLSKYRDLSSEGPGGWRFAAQEEKNLIPQTIGAALMITGPGDPGFLCSTQSNLIPQEQERVVKDKRQSKSKQNIKTSRR